MGKKTLDYTAFLNLKITFMTINGHSKKLISKSGANVRPSHKKHSKSPL